MIGALTLGALAATMGSGFTKYAEAIHAKPAGTDAASDSARRPAIAHRVTDDSRRTRQPNPTR